MFYKTHTLLMQGVRLLPRKNIRIHTAADAHIGSVVTQLTLR